MAFCGLSNELALRNSIAVSDVFINEFLPKMNGDCVRVYLYGLLLACGGSAVMAGHEIGDNNLESFSKKLNIALDDVISAFTYLADLGLVQVLRVEPMEVKYLPVRTGQGSVKLYAKGKYDEFNAQMQAIIEDRSITPSEFRDYYSIIESMGIEQDAFVMVAKYCADLKGKNVGSAYIQTVAKNWAYLGAKTGSDLYPIIRDKVETDKAVAAVLLKLDLVRLPRQSDCDFYIMWKRTWEFSDKMIDYAITLSKDKASPIVFMNKVLGKWFEKKIATVSAAQKLQEEKPKGAGKKSEKKIVRHSYQDDELDKIADDVNKDVF